MTAKEAASTQTTAVSRKLDEISSRLAALEKASFGPAVLANPVTAIVEANDRRRHELIRDWELSQGTALPLSSTVVRGDCKEVLPCLPAESAGLIFTSIPYFNARPEYAWYESFGDYLGEMWDVLPKVIRVLQSGRFLVVNVSPILQRRRCRSESSRRLALHFYVAMMLEAQGLECVDEIIWRTFRPSSLGP
jgi:hypothetical protein